MAAQTKVAAKTTRFCVTLSLSKHPAPSRPCEMSLRWVNGEERTLRSVFHISASSADSLDSPCEETILCGRYCKEGMNDRFLIDNSTRKYIEMQFRFIYTGVRILRT